MSRVILRVILHSIHLAAMLVVAALYAAPAYAVQTYCVGTPAEFQAALDSAEVDGEDSRIDVLATTYELSSDLVYDAALGGIVPAGKLTIEGGYGPSCLTQTDDATLTTLRGNGNQSLFADTTWDSLTIKSLSFEAVELATYFSTQDYCADGGSRIELRRLRFEDARLYTEALCQDIVLRDSLIVNGPSGANGELVVALTVLDDFSRTPSLTVINSSLVNARARLLSFGDAQGVAYLYNSIFSDSGADIYAEGTSVFARNNRYDGISFLPDVNNNLPAGTLLFGSANNVNSAPDLDADYRPNPGSPMVDTGSSAVPDGLASIDLFGDDRLVGENVDRGAIELQAPPPPTDVYTVVNTGISGVGSLAAAVDLANADSDFDTIKFNIPGPCPRNIEVPTTLSIRDGVLIDGWSQPGSVKNNEDRLWVGRPCVILDGNGTTGTGLLTDPQLGNERMSVRGLAFEGFSSAILMTYGDENAIAGNQFGGQIGSSGTVLTGNENAITIAGSASAVIVGGYDPSQANLIGGSNDTGIVITGNSDGHQVVGNRIGVDRNGNSALSNEDGLRISTANNRVALNRIAHNRSDGISLNGADAKENLIVANDIDHNARMGIMIDNSAHDNSVIGDNLIASNGDSGVRVLGAAGGRNFIVSNRIAGNGAPGIDLGANGVTENDPDPLACPGTTGCLGNGGQNFPVIEAAYRLAGPESVYVVIPARLTTVPSDSPYRIDFYRSNDCDESGYGQGSRWIGSKNATVVQDGFCFNGNCPVDINFIKLYADIEIGQAVSATATSPGGSTSEFAACVLVEEGTLGDDTIFKDGFDGD